MSQVSFLETAAGALFQSLTPSIFVTLSCWFFNIVAIRGIKVACGLFTVAIFVLFVLDLPCVYFLRCDVGHRLGVLVAAADWFHKFSLAQS